MPPTTWAHPSTFPGVSVREETTVRTTTDYTLDALMIITNEPFLKPSYNYVPYFEVKIVTLPAKGTIAIGLTNPTKNNTILPGWAPGTWGYHSDDGGVFIEKGNPDVHYDQFTVGDIIGCGRNLYHQIFFTKNGNLMGTTSLSPKTIGSLFYPAVGFDIKNSRIDANFGESPFMFDLSHVSVGLIPPKAAIPLSHGPRMSDVDMVVLERIASFLPLNSVVAVARVNKAFANVSRSNEIWAHLTTEKWPNVVKTPNIKNWKKFYMRRAGATKTGKKPVRLLENCYEWEFKCPMTLDKLTRTADPTVDFCGVCKKNVFLVNNMEDLGAKVSGGMCVALDFDRSVARERRPERVLMGKVARR